MANKKFTVEEICDAELKSLQFVQKCCFFVMTIMTLVMFGSFILDGNIKHKSSKIGFLYKESALFMCLFPVLQYIMNGNSRKRLRRFSKFLFVIMVFMVVVHFCIFTLIVRFKDNNNDYFPSLYHGGFIICDAILRIILAMVWIQCEWYVIKLEDKLIGLEPIESEPSIKKNNNTNKKKRSKKTTRQRRK